MSTTPLKRNEFINYSLLRRHVGVLLRYNDATALFDQLPKKNMQNKIFFHQSVLLEEEYSEKCLIHTVTFRVSKALL